MKIKRETKITIAAVFGLYLVFNLVRVLFMPGHTVAWHLQLAGYGLVVMALMAFVIRIIDLQLDKYIPFERNILLRIFLQIALTFGIVVLLRYFLYPFVTSVLGITLSHDLYIVSYFINLLTVTTLILSIFGYHFVNRWKQSQITQAQLEREKAQIQFDNLKNQLNPHFLFNSLSSLNSLIFENPQLASEFLQQLSKVYRYLLSHKDRDLVLLDKEVDFVSHYVSLLKTRFDEGLIIHFDITEEAREKRIAPVTIQILLENALKHNMASKELPLRIDILANEDSLTVRNNLQVRATETSNKVGLENLKNLYQYITERKVEVVQDANYFTVKIPLVP